MGSAERREGGPLGRWLLLVLCAGTLGGCVGPRYIEYEVRLPEQVREGERFQIHAYVKNLHRKKVQVLRDVDIADELRLGFSIDRADPTPEGVMHLERDRSLSFSFDLALEPGDSGVVTFWCEADRPGFYTGTVDLCINSVAKCIYVPVKTVVE